VPVIEERRHDHQLREIANLLRVSLHA
jgi:hypothetical protein